MNDELSYNERKEWVKQIYTTEDKDIKDIALQTNTDEAEIRLWATQHRWEGYKDALLTSKANQLEVFRTELKTISDKVKSGGGAGAKDIDLFVKYTTAAKELEQDPSISTIIEVLELFTQWLRRKDKPLAKKMVVQMSAFVEQRIAA